MKYIASFLLWSLIALGLWGTSVYATETQTVSGQLQRIHEDNLTTRVSTTRYRMRDHSGGWVFISFLNGKVPDAASSVRVQGIRTGNTLEVDLLVQNSLVLSTTQAPRSVIGPKKTAVILFNFQDEPNNKPHSTDTIRSITFTSANSVNAYYKEASFQQMSLVGKERTDGDVFGWVTIPYVSTSPCVYVDWIAAANSIVASQGVDLSGYDAYMYDFPSTPSCSFSGLSYSNIGVIHGPYQSFIVSHEMGHILGTGHAKSIACRDSDQQPVPIGPNCIIGEYGDPYDVMAATLRHHNTRTKQLFGWYAVGNMRTVTQTGRYTLVPIEQSASGTQSLRIPKPVEYDATGSLIAADPGSYYYFEYRRPFGFDSFLPSDPVIHGTTIRIDDAHSDLGTYLVDTTPGDGTFSNATLVLGRTFIDASNGVRVNVVTATSASMDIDIQYDAPAIPTLTASTQCLGGAPVVSLTWSQGGSGVGFVERCTGDTCQNFSGIGQSRDGSYVDTRVASGESYRYRVRIQKPSGAYGPYSRPIVHTPECQSISPTPTSTPMPIAAPVVSSTLSCEKKQVELQWVSLTRSVISSHVERCVGTASGCSTYSEVVHTVNSVYQDALVDRLKTYWYRVRYHDHGSGAYSPYSNVTSHSLRSCIQ